MPIELTLPELRSLLTPPVVPVGDGIEMPPAAERREIVIADRGWVFVGLVTARADGLHLREASVVRVWGTTRGIGQLAAEGPLNGTKLDTCGEVIVPTFSVVARIACAADKWR